MEWNQWIVFSLTLTGRYHETHVTVNENEKLAPVTLVTGDHSVTVSVTTGTIPTFMKTELQCGIYKSLLQILAKVPHICIRVTNRPTLNF